MKRILITGGAGFIGSRLATVLNTQGHHVTILDNLLAQVHGSDPTTSGLLAVARQAGDVVVGDVTDRAVLEQVVSGQDVVVHLAAETGTGQSMYEI